ncbi:galactose oxidase [Microthyrium microscopicum]|uniref:Galactose oxidase n=1 Tax=Microthyrium microscopicum TaxID=703497 RepID=A0A6A6TXA2_9PEZI|nr:galactose oxidase [Microthyrium microscopicum]
MGRYSSLATLALLFTAITALPQSPPSTNCFRALAPIAEGARQEHGAAAVGTNLYIVAGMRNWKLGTSVEKYDTIANKWSTVAPTEMGMHHPNVASVDGKVYLLGGLTTLPNVTSGLWPSELNVRCYAYDPAKDTWEKLAPLPDPRGSAMIAVHGKKIYLVGGVVGPGKVLDVVSVYDTVSNTWSKLSDKPLPEGRDHGGGAVVGDTFYAVAGRLGSQTSRQNSLYALNLVDPAAKWQTLMNMPSARGGIAVSALGRKIYVFGGEGNPEPNTQGVYSNVESFDTETKSWAVEAPMKVPRHGTPATTVGDRIFIAGGGVAQGGAKGVATVESYGPGPC